MQELLVYPAHHITMGEGGAVTNNPVMNKLLESLETG